MKKSKFIIVPEGGLANRMRAITSAIKLSEKCNQELSIIWNKNKFLKADFNAIFDSPELTKSLSTPGELKYRLLYDLPRKKNLFLSGVTNKFFGNKLLDITREEDINLLHKMTERGHKNLIVHSGIIFEDFHDETIRNLFKPSYRVKERIKELLGNQKPGIAIHIRRTDNKESIEKSPTYLFEKIIEREIAGKSDVGIFLATDEQPLKFHLKNKYPDNIIINETKAERNTEDGIVDAAAELFILASCKKIYGSFWSSFSEVASMIGGVPLEVVKNF